MAPKKQKPNGFVLFAQELMGKHGRKFTNLKDACDGAAPLWANMSKDQRRPYEERAKGEKLATYTSQGRNVQELTKEQEQATKAEENAKAYIQSHLQRVRDQGELPDELFFIIDVNIFCYYQKENQYFPAEIAVSCFNLRDGVMDENVFHRMIKPGPLPIGYKFDAKQHSDGTHVIEVPIDDEDNTEEVYFNLKHFLEEKNGTGRGIPILYAQEKYSKVIKTILDSWSEAFERKNEMYPVYNLEYMFYVLRNKCSAETVWVSDTFSRREIEKDVYAYQPNIACSFHISSAKPVYCSKSRVSRYAYIICSHCCSDLGLQLMEGQHVPLTFTAVDARSKSSRSSQSSLYKGSYQNLYASSDTTWNDTDKDSVFSYQSEATTIQHSNFDDEFPSLGARTRYSSNSSSVASQAPVLNYAGAANTTLADAFNNMSIMQTASKGAIPKVKPKFTPDSDSESSAFDSFPALDRQPPRGRGLRKPRSEPRAPGKF